MGRVRLPLTARDVQRMLAAGQDGKLHQLVGDDRLTDLIADALDIPRWPHEEPPGWQREKYELWLKRLNAALATAAQRNPNRIIIAARAEIREGSGEARPKGTDEVHPQGSNPSENSPCHGGDGCSGEVAGGPAPASPEGGDTPEDGAPPAAETGQATSAGAGEQPAEGRTNPENRDGDSAAVERSGGGGNAASDDGADRPVHEAPADAPQEVGESTGWTAAEEAVRDGKSQQPGGGSSEPPALPKGRKFAKFDRKRKAGGWSLASFASLADCRADPKLVGQLREALGRLAGLGTEDVGPRWDWDAFCVRLLTHRPVAAARREEEVKRPALLVMVDTSGSCCGFTDFSLPVALAAGKLGVPGCSVVVVNHANGYPHEAEMDGKSCGVPPCFQSENEVFAWYEGILKRHSLRAVINLGDLDAEWLVCRLASVKSVEIVVWLDNYACNYLDGPTLPRERRPWPANVQRKIRRYVGCRDAVDLVEGLRMALASLAH